MVIKKSLRVYGMIFILSILLIVSVYQLFVFMMLDLLDKELQGWQGQESASESYTRWENQRPMVDLLVSVSPYSGAVQQSSARFYQLGAELASAAPSSMPVATQHQDRALQLIRQSLSNQPIWPLAWMDLAFIKSSLGLFDDEFQQAFSLAISTGAAETNILLGMTEVGFAGWRDLSAANRLQFVSLLDIAVLRERQHVIEAAEYHQRTYIVCLLISEKQAMEQYCKNR